MKKRTLVLFFLLLLPFGLMAQRAKGVITGMLCDSIFASPPLGNYRVVNATATLMRLQDSSLVAFSLTDTAGYFSFNRIQEGKYRLLFTHPAYHSYSRNITITADSIIVQLGKIWLTHRSVQLAEVVIAEDAPPVTFKGDTLEFNAGSFRTAPNATAEDLLKKMPGVQVNSDGTYTVNGKRVTKILVDGKEFFLDDPALAGRNIPADAVKKVQVFQKASDSKEATGVDDGNDETTINLSLKEDRRDGGFGTFLGGIGTEGRYKTGINYNRFNGARRISVIANTNNINERAFTTQDLTNNSPGSGNPGDIVTRSNMSDDNGSSLTGQQTGINTIWAGGLNYNDNWGKYTTISARYFFNHRERDQLTESIRNYALPDSFFTTSSIATADNYNDNHRFAATFEYLPDTSTKIRLRPAFSLTNSRSFSLSNFDSRNNSDELFNTGQNTNFNGRDAWSFSNVAQLTHKMHKERRSIFFSLNSSLRNGLSFVEPDNRTLFFRENNILSLSFRKQRNDQYENRNDQRFTINWSEPIRDRGTLVLIVQASAFQVRTDRNVFNVDTLQPDRLIQDPTLSNDFKMAFRYVSTGFNYNYTQNRHNLTFGTNLQQSQLIGINIETNIGNTQQFTHVLPFIRYKFEVNTYKSLIINGSSNVIAPESNDLNPIRDVTDPLIVIAGNPLLSPEQQYRASIQWHSVDPSSGRSFITSLTYGLTDRPIVKATNIDNFGRQVIQSVNGEANDYASFYINTALPLSKLKSALDLDFFSTLQRIKTPVNFIQNENINLLLSPELIWSFLPTDSIELRIVGDFSFSNGLYSLTQQRSNSFFSQRYGLELLWQTKLGVTFESTFDYTIVENTNKEFQTIYPLWIVAASYQFLKAQRGEVKLSVFDLLNSNTGVNQNVQPTYVEVMRYNTLRRYAMLSFSYRLGERPKRKE